MTITHGMLYVGSDAGTNEPSLINPKLSVSSRNVATAEALPYWPSYAIMSAGTRYRYLQWLASGAEDPEIDLGFVFVFFYGLERRLVLDGGAAETPALLGELDRLVSIYGEKGSVRYYALRLKEYIQLRRYIQEASDDLPDFDSPLIYELPIALRVGLGRFARDQKPLPLAWALRWAVSDPLISRRTPVGRCPDVFARAFAQVYQNAYGDGLVLPQNKTKLKFSYKSASAALKEQNLQFKWDDMPDVLAVTGPQKKLQALVEEATCLIDSYSRFLGRNNERAETLHAYLMLPAHLWPESAAQKIRDIRDSAVNNMKPLTYGEMFARLGGTEIPTAHIVCDLARALNQNRIGMEPDVLAGARRPGPTDTIILFPLSSERDDDRTTAEYRNASLNVALSASLALADGEASDAELQAIEKRIATWTHLHTDLQMRLRAQYRLQICQPASLSTLKTKIAGLSLEARLELAIGLSSLAKADGVVSPGEVKLLERLYRTLQLDPQLVYSHLHCEEDRQTSAVASFDKPAKQGKNKISLDLGRIVQLQRDTEKVSALLATVFEEEDMPESAIPASSALADTATELESANVAAPSPLPGLDKEHTAFLVLLLTRPVWSRKELLAAAADMQVMLDGALERINDAALDITGNLLIEGDDPVYIDRALLETVAT